METLFLVAQNVLDKKGDILYKYKPFAKTNKQK